MCGSRLTTCTRPFVYICTHLVIGHGKWVEHGAIKTWSDHCMYQMFPLQAQVLQWKCFKKLQHVYDTHLWSVIEPTLDAIVAGIKVRMQVTMSFTLVVVIFTCNIYIYIMLRM